MDESTTLTDSGGGGGEINLRRGGADLTGDVHLLPCCVKLDGPAPVSHYFKPRPSGMVVDGVEGHEAFFRGRKLDGAAVRIPDGYRGYVLEKKKMVDKEDSESQEGSVNCWESRAEFKSLTYWNHDTSIPSANDPIPRCFHWLGVAKSLHKPVTEDQLASILDAQKTE